MYAIVEFMSSSDDGTSSGSISIVPLIWLHPNHKKCYWPNKVGNMSFEDFVKRQSPFKQSWTSHKVFKVYYKTADYGSAESKLTEILQNNVSEVDLSGGAVHLLEKDKMLVSDSDAEEDESESVTKEKVETAIGHPDTRNNSSDLTRTPYSSMLNLSKPDCNVPNIEKNKNNPSSGSGVNSPYTEIDQSSGITLTPSSSCTLNSSSRLSISGQTEFEERVLKCLSKITETVDQHSVALGQLLRRSGEFSTVAPDNLPEFPLNTMNCFNNLENMLSDDDVKQYMVRRLAAVGGSGVAELTRRIMKFLMSNDLGQHFNWKGRDKVSFEKTKTMEIIYEAAKLHFPTQERSDKVIATTVKEWLKYSKTRLKAERRD